MDTKFEILPSLADNPEVLEYKNGPNGTLLQHALKLRPPTHDIISFLIENNVNVNAISLSEDDPPVVIGVVYEIFVRKRALVKYQSQSELFKMILYVSQF